MRQYTISELGTLKNGLNFSAEKVKNGIKMVGVPNFADNFFVPNYGLAEVNKDVVPKEMLLQTNDILFVRSNGNKALVGRTIIMNNISEPTTFSGFCIRFRPNTDLVSPLYLLYLFKSPLFRKLFSSNQQTSISNLNQEILGELKVNLPTLERQNELVAAIHCLTRKIEANKVINDNLAA